MMRLVRPLLDTPFLQLLQIILTCIVIPVMSQYPQLLLLASSFNK